MSDLSEIISGAVAESGISEADNAADTPVVETADTPDSTVTETAVAADKTADTPAAETRTPEQIEEDELRAVEADLVTKTPGLKQGRISVARHQAVLTRQRNKAEADRKAAVAKYEKYDAQEWREREAAIDLAENHPDVFFREVLLKSPAYAQLVEKELESRGLKVPAAIAAAADKATTVPDPGEKPKPDVLRDDGSLGYSDAQREKLYEWQLATERVDTQKKIDALNAQVKPVLEERQSAATRQHFNQQANAMLTEARTNWDGFKEHEQEIYDHMMKPENRRMSLDAGYRAIVIPKLKGQREALEAQIRKDVVASLNQPASRTKSVRPGVPAPSGTEDENTPRKTSDLIKEALAAAGQ